MAAVSPTRTPPAWVGNVGIGLGTVLGAAGCYLLAHFL
jgi:hypothetical protein